MGTNKDISRVLNEWFDNKLFEIHTVLPGKFVSYEGHNTRKSRVQPLITMRDDKNDTYRIDPIDNVPVIFPSNSKFNFLFPIRPNDGCLLLFSEVSIGNYLNSRGNIVDPDDNNKFDLTDCIAIPGLWSFNNIPSSTTISIEIGDDDSITLETSLGKMKIESSGNITFDDGREPYVLGTALNTWITTVLLTIFNAHTHSSPAGGSTGTPSTPLTAPTNYLSNFIKGK